MTYIYVQYFNDLFEFSWELLTTMCNIYVDYVKIIKLNIEF